jgi:hypothetical protein
MHDNTLLRTIAQQFRTASDTDARVHEQSAETHNTRKAVDCEVLTRTKPGRETQQHMLAHVRALQRDSSAHTCRYAHMQHSQHIKTTRTDKQKHQKNTNKEESDKHQNCERGERERERRRVREKTHIVHGLKGREELG